MGYKRAPIIIAAVLALLARTSIGALDAADATIEIDPGDDTQKIVAAAPAGTAFVLTAGVHRLQAITPKDGQSFTGEPGAILSGARLLTSFTRVGTAWVASNQTQQGEHKSSPADGVCKATSPRCDYPEDLFLDDVPLQHVDSVSNGAPGKWFFDYDADRIFLWDNPSGKKVETSVLPQAFSGKAKNVTIRTLVIEKYATPTQSEAVSLGPGWRLENSDVRLNHFAGIGTGGSSVTRGNHIHHNGAVGCSGAGSGILIENNEIDHNNYAGYNPYWGAGGAKWVYTDGLIVRGNFSHHNDGPGLWTDINNINTLYENNTVEDNARGGIFHEISYAAIIRSNSARRNGTARDYPGWTTGAGIEILDSPDVEVYGNTLVDNWQGITGLDDGRHDPAVENHGPWRLVNLNVHDNSITQSTSLGPGSGRTGIITTVSGTFTTGNNRFHDNVYSLGAYTKYFIWDGADRTESEWKTFNQDSTSSFKR